MESGIDCSPETGFLPLFSGQYPNLLKKPGFSTHGIIYNYIAFLGLNMYIIYGPMNVLSIEF